ncbi:MAG: hypothetical protein VX815_01210 [Gemmatimonadota bacterium]|jgi:hypothetical protein|nr:hypothetical protein [Gemmatimonadota bacterium]
MGESRDRTGTAYALTVITAISPGQVEEVRKVIEGVPRGVSSPLAKLGTVHTSRLQIFDHLVYQGAPQKRDQLRWDYLVFTAAFDGHDLDPFLDSIVDQIPDEADSWWRHCLAYPGLKDRTAFKKWIRDNQVHTSLFAVASPNRSVPEVLESLALRERLVEFAIANQNQQTSAAELRERFRSAFGGEV